MDFTFINSKFQNPADITFASQHLLIFPESFFFFFVKVGKFWQGNYQIS